MQSDELRQKLEGSTDVLDVADALAQASAAGQLQPRAGSEAEQDARAAVLDELSAEVRRLGGHLGLRVPGNVLSAALMRVAGSSNLATAAWIGLRALDRVFGRDLGQMLQARGGKRHLVRGGVFPIAARDWREPPVALKQLTAKPSGLGVPFEELEYLGVLPVQPGSPEVVFDFDAGSALGGLHIAPAIAFLCPNRRFVGELVDGKARRPDAFFGVTPARPDDQRKAILDGLKTIAGLDVAVVVAPELSTTEELVEEMGAYFHATRQTASLLVAGSRHGAEETVQFNRSSIFAATSELVHHDKFNPFLWKTEGKVFEEDIDSNPSKLIRVHWSQGMTFVVLICKDLLDAAAINTLAAVRPNFIFVPALTDELSEMSKEASHLAIRGQSVIAISNCPYSRRDLPHCHVVLPTRTGDTHDILDARPPSIQVFNLGPNRWTS